MMQNGSGEEGQSVEEEVVIVKPIMTDAYGELGTLVVKQRPHGVCRCIDWSCMQASDGSVSTIV